jgi:hypothetical protein
MLFDRLTGFLSLSVAGDQRVFWQDSYFFDQAGLDLITFL